MLFFSLQSSCQFFFKSGLYRAIVRSSTVLLLQFCFLVKSCCIGPVLRWFRSYLVGRSQHARHGSTTSTAVHLIYNGTVPGYLQSCFTRLADMTSRQRLRSSASHRLAVLPIRLSAVGRRAFPVSNASTQRPSIARH